MSFQGNLSSVGFSDILQLLAMGKKTGTLQIRRGENSKDICFKDGSIIWATSNDSLELLENQLLKHGKISKNDLTKAKEVMNLTGKDLPSTLVFLGILDKSKVAEFMMKHIEAIVFDVFSWTEGEFVFKDNELPDNEQIINALNTMSILMEGTRRIDEWTRIRNSLPPDNTVLVVSASIEQKDEVRLTPIEAQILSLIDGERSIEEIKDKSSASELDTSRAIYGLLASGLIQKSGVKESKKAKTDEQKQILQVIAKVYEIVFDIIRKTISQKLGKASIKQLISVFEKTKKEHKILEYIVITEEGDFNFVNFVTLAEKLPEESRIHIVSSGLSALLGSTINMVQSTLGTRQWRQIASQSIANTEELLAKNGALLKKYGVFSDFFRVLQ